MTHYALHTPYTPPQTWTTGVAHSSQPLTYRATMASSNLCLHHLQSSFILKFIDSWNNMKLRCFMIAIMTTQDHNEAGYQTTQGIISSNMFLESAASNLNQFTVVQWTYIGTEEQWHWFVIIYGIFSNNTSLITSPPIYCTKENTILWTT